MPDSRIRTPPLWGCAAALILVAGCASASAGMRPSETPNYAAHARAAKVIFVRDAGHATGTHYLVVDRDRQFVAMLDGNMHTTVEVPEGEHSFYFVAENSEPIHATVHAGRTYIIHVKPHASFEGSGVTAKAVPMARLAEVRGWLMTTRAMEPDHESGNAWVDEHREHVAAKVSQANTDWADHNTTWRQNHTLEAKDGIKAKDLGL